MAYLYTHNGKLLQVGTKLAANVACCCNGVACCIPTWAIELYEYDPLADNNIFYVCTSCCQGLEIAYTYSGTSKTLRVPLGADAVNFAEEASPSGDAYVYISYACEGNQLKITLTLSITSPPSTHTYEGFATPVAPTCSGCTCCFEAGSITITQTSTPDPAYTIDSVTLVNDPTPLYYGAFGHTDPAEVVCGAGCDLGACCKSDGTCAIMTADDCATAGGVFHPDTDCVAEFCWSACCSNDNTGTYENLGCTNQPTQAACEGQDTMGGTITYIWQEGWKCEISGVGPCVGLCCFDGDCYNYTEAQCADQGGYWTPDSFGTMCLGSPNGVPCICVDASECPAGMCCVPYEPGDPDPYGQCAPCSGSDPEGCPAGYCSSGAPDYTCLPCDCNDPNVCPDGYCCDGAPDYGCGVCGACCYNDGVNWVCASMSETACLAADGTWKGANTVCEDYDCTVGCCDGVSCTDDNGSYNYALCTRGREIGVCASNCTSDTFTRNSIHPFCQQGTDLPTSVTGTGFTSPAVNPTTAAIIEAAFNNTYAINRDCCNGNQDTIIGCTNVIRYDTTDPAYYMEITWPQANNATSSRSVQMTLRLTASGALVCRAGRRDGPTGAYAAYAYNRTSSVCTNLGTNARYAYVCDEPIGGAVNFAQAGASVLDSTNATITCT